MVASSCPFAASQTYYMSATASTAAILGSMWAPQAMLVQRLQVRIDGTAITAGSIVATLLTSATADMASPTTTSVTASLASGTLINDSTHCALVPSGNYFALQVVFSSGLTASGSATTCMVSLQLYWVQVRAVGVLGRWGCHALNDAPERHSMQ
jgi:hypothetical protein